VRRPRSSNQPTVSSYMEPEDTLPCEQHLAACHCPVPHEPTPCFCETHFNLCQIIPRCRFPSGFLAKVPYVFLISSIRATCPAHPIPCTLRSSLLSSESLSHRTQEHQALMFLWPSLSHGGDAKLTEESRLFQIKMASWFNKIAVDIFKNFIATLCFIE
jgi:hypothetical protein